ncbi:glycerate kinase, partial [Streptococcus thermophilus]
GQKGLAPSQVKKIDQNMAQFYQGFAPEVPKLAGSGAGGGMAAGMVAFAGAEIKSGIDFVLDCVDFDQRVKTADLVIVGEGRMDNQSLSGKAPVGVAKRTPSAISVIAICGSLKDDLPDFPSQKGLAPSQVKKVDQNMAQFYQGFAPEVPKLAGSGAGGGIAAGMVAFAGAEIKSGIDFVLDCVDFDQRVKTADLVIVGEGRMDNQSLSGKAPVGVAKRTPSAISVIAICGSLKDDLPDFP